MLYQLVQHVVVEFEAGVDPWCSGSVQIQKQADFSFFRVSFQFGPSGTGAAEIINNFRPGGQGGVCFGVVFFAETELGRASCRERVCQKLYISVVVVRLKKK